MSDVTSYLTATIARQKKNIANAVIERNELLKFLKKKGRINMGVGGDSIKWRVYSTEPNVFGSTTDWAARTAQTQQPFTVAEVRYAQYDGIITMNEFQLQRNKQAGPEAQMFKQLAEELKVFKHQAIQRIGKHAYNGVNTTYTGDQGTGISGLTDIVSATGTYAGIARASATYWCSQTAAISNPELDTDGNDVPQMLQGMRALWLDCSGGASADGGVSDQMATDKEEPDFILTTKAIYLNYQNCLHPQMRYSGTEAKRDTEPASLVFNDKDITWDTYCPTGKMWFINSKYLTVDCCSDSLIDFPEKFQAVPVQDRNALTWKGIAQLQMYSENPRYHGVATFS
jgi:hypothetical protein